MYAHTRRRYTCLTVRTTKVAVVRDDYKRGTDERSGWRRTLGGNGGAKGVAAFLYKIDSAAKLIGEPAEAEPQIRDKARCLVAIGASSGGPAALVKMLGGLPAGLPASVVIVQQIDAQFA